MRGLSKWRGYFIVVAVAGVAWSAAATLLVPSLIRQAYAGESWSFLNAIISGQDVRTVDNYLAAWSGVALGITAVLLVLALLVAGLLRWPGIPSSLLAGVKKRVPTLTDGEVLMLAAFFGVTAGLAEALRRVAWYRVLRLAAGEVISGEVYWMAPAAATLFLVALAVILIGLRRMAPPAGFIAGLAPFLFAGLSVYSFGRSMVFGLHPLALLVLGAGVGGVATGLVAAHPLAVRRWTGRVVAAGAIGLTAWALALGPVRRAAESWARRGIPEASAGAPNVVLIVWDTVRALSLSLYGHDRPTTPNLERLAQRGVVFDRATAPAPWTLPSHASLFTGRYYHEISARHDAPLDATFPTLAEVLGNRGYQTGGFVANEYYGGTGFGLQRGFQWYEAWKPVSVPLTLSTWWATNEVSWRVGSWLDLWPPLRVTAEDVNRSFLAWLDRREQNRPFFAFLNFFDAHEPYRVPGTFGFAFGEDDPMFAWKADPAASYSPEELQALRDAYESCILYLDHQLGLLLEDLEARGVLENTLFILTSDHGETLGEHSPDLLGHENNIYNDVLGVPLVFRLPSRLPAGVRSPTPVSLVDIPATVMDILGEPGLPHPFPGITLVPHMATSSAAGAVSASLAQTDAMEWHLSYSNWPVAAGSLSSLVEGPYHYIVNERGEESLFDIEADPWERYDRARVTGEAETLASFRRSLRSLLGGTPAGSVR